MHVCVCVFHVRFLLSSQQQNENRTGLTANSKLTLQIWKYSEVRLSWISSLRTPAVPPGWTEPLPAPPLLLALLLPLPGEEAVKPSKTFRKLNFFILNTVEKWKGERRGDEHGTLRGKSLSLFFLISQDRSS